MIAKTRSLTCAYCKYYPLFCKFHSILISVTMQYIKSIGVYGFNRLNICSYNLLTNLAFSVHNLSLYFILSTRLITFETFHTFNENLINPET